jgi:hypothetical protein
MPEDKKMTIGDLAAMSQREFLAIGGRFDAIDRRLDGMATKHELAAVREDLKAAIDSSASRVVGEIKEFMQPHIKSLDAVLVDAEKLKRKVKI